jgi:hypothetical protein
MGTNVRIVNSANDCKKPEHVLQWSGSGQGSPGPAGKVVLSGGASVVDASPNARTILQESAPETFGDPAQSAWLVAIQNNDPVQHPVGIFAVCANVSQ